MAVKKTISITDRTIPGITWKQVVSFAFVIGGAIWVYFNLTGQIQNAQQVSKDNNLILREIQTDRKESERINNIRLTNIELDQREAKIRLTTLEQKLK